MIPHVPPGTHLDDDLIERFVLGEVSETTAVLAAEHIDACPYCSARAAHCEPLSTLFAHLPDPVVPDGLVAAVLAEAAQPEPSADAWVDPATPEIAVGGLLLIAAAALVGFGDWAALASQTLHMIESARAVEHALSRGMPAPMVLLPLTVLTGALCVLVVVVSAQRTQGFPFGHDGPERAR